jgi:hypothetical protein
VPAFCDEGWQVADATLIEVRTPNIGLLTELITIYMSIFTRPLGNAILRR